MARKTTNNSLAKTQEQQDADEDFQYQTRLHPSHKTFALDPDDVDLATQQPKRKSMYTMVDERLQRVGRAQLINDLKAIFGCSVPTIDRAIHEVHKDWAAYLTQTRSKRMGRYIRRQDSLYAEAVRKGDTSIANRINMDQAKLIGDAAPDVTLLLGGDKTPAQLLAQADELRKLSEPDDEDEE